MTNIHRDIQLSPEQRNSLIASYPLFCLLDADNIHELASRTREVFIDKGTTITKEGDIVNSVYFIISGTAEVTKSLALVGKNEVIHIATLGEKDAIGLSDIGFFSHSGIRTATVTATSDMKLLVLDLGDFYNYLQLPGITYPALKEVNEKILLMNFIQQMHLFRHFSNEKIRQLATRVKKLSVPAHTYFFKQGDIADKCYFILQGKVAIFSSENNVEHLITTLEASSLFGEGVFLDKGKRNASARALTDCELFILERDQVVAFTATAWDETLMNSLNLLRMQQLRPARKQDVSLLESTTAEGELIYNLENIAEGLQLRLSQQDYLLWNAIDGKTPLQQIHSSHELLKNSPLHDLYLHVFNMAQAGFIKLSEDI